MRMWFAASLAMLVFDTGCGVTESRADGHLSEPTIKVETAPVAEKSIGTFVTVTGQLVANQRSQVASDGTGRVIATMVERGQPVAAGEPLVKLYARSASLSFADARAQVEALTAQADRARKDCTRADDLFRQNTISQADYDRLKMDCKATGAQANAALARSDLAGKAVNDATVRAPFAGVVDERQVNVGEYVRAGTSVATIVQVDPMRVQVTVPESLVGLVHEGQSMEFDVSAYPGSPFPATVKYLSGAIREKSRDLLVEGITPNKEGKLRPGMFVTARIRVGDETLPVVPAAAVRIDGSVARLYVVKAGKVEERLVQLGRRDGDLIAVRAGVKKGEKIVAKITADVHDGVKVE